MVDEPRTRAFRERGRRRPWGALALVAVLAPALAAGGCENGGSHRKGGAAGREEAVKPAGPWARLARRKEALDAKRARLAKLLAAASTGEGDAGPPGELAVDRLRREIDREAAALRRVLVAFINADPPLADEPRSPVQRAALRMKGAEEILLAREFVERGGDYRRAIELCEAALAVDPGNPELGEELGRIRRLRYMNGERFGRVKKGMTRGEVREVLGQPNLQDVRAYPERRVEAWFYPKDPTGSAAAVWFQEARDGDSEAYVVYQTDFEALDPGAPGEPAAPAGSVAPADR